MGRALGSVKSNFNARSIHATGLGALARAWLAPRRHDDSATSYDIPISMSTTLPFAGEAFLKDPVPPDVISERPFFTAQLFLTIVVLVAVAPYLLSKLDQTQADDKEAFVSVKWLPRLNIIGILLSGYWILSTSNNYYSARSVFVAPLLSNDECQHLIQSSHEAAQRNLKQFPDNDEFKQSPKGWRKERHGSYPTTDLNLVTDPFTKEDRKYLGTRLHARLSPLISRLYGVPPTSIRANDMFVVRYDAHEGQQALSAHTDEAHVSVNILLNDDFDGGGTRFHNRWTGEHLDVFPPKGSVLLSNAVIRHEGLPTTRGTRYILVGFLQVDRRHAFTGMNTGLSLFSSLLSMPWVHVRCKQGISAILQRQRLEQTKLTDAIMYQWFTGMSTLLQHVGDFWAPHRSYSLIHADNGTDYLAALDSAPTVGAIWFQGQRRVKKGDKVIDRHDPRELS